MPYLPGEESSTDFPLARFLPLVPEGIGAAFLARQGNVGGWVLDPFGTSPAFDVELARRGRKVLVAVNNPVTRFLLELAASPPPVETLKTALASLATVYKGEERLETHLQSLYLTECSRCQRQVPVKAFIWEKGAKTPSGRIYHCPCGESGEFPSSQADLAHTVRLSATDSLHRARALERVSSPGDPDREHAEHALAFYLPRAVYALVTIINKLGNIIPTVSKEHRRALLALVLVACDEGNMLWPHPVERPRPRQLTIPPRFLEKNLWLALEHAAARWGSAKPIPMKEWERLPSGKNSPFFEDEQGGLYIFDGPVRALAPALDVLQPGAMVTVVPRPNQAFWTLSALWAGWLWGQSAVEKFKPVLRRRRYDWNWHASALHAALREVAPRLPLNMPFFAVLPEPEPAFLSAVLVAASAAGFDLEGLVLRTRNDPIQVVLRRRAFLHKQEEQPGDGLQLLPQALAEYLGTRGEPVPYLHLHACGLVALAANRLLRWQEEPLQDVHARLEAARNDPAFLHLSASPDPESGLWGLKHPETPESLPDRVEIALVRYLQKTPAATMRDVEIELNQVFPGLLTPSLGLLRAILTSYAEEHEYRWTLRTQDAPAVRLADLDQAARNLAGLAARLGYAVSEAQHPWRTLKWLDGGQTVVSFHLLTSAVVGRILLSVPAGQPGNVLVLPGGRAGLLAYKLGRDPHLKKHAEGWQVLKFRQLRRLVEMTSLSRERWEKELANDPLEPPEQMKLF